MTGHTATPWHIVTCVEPDATTRYIDDEFGAEGGRDYYLAELKHGDEDELQANAEFIVRACNSHDQLVKAATLAYQRLLTLGEYQGRSTMHGQYELSLLRDSISEATGIDCEEVQCSNEAIAYDSRAALSAAGA